MKLFSFLPFALCFDIFLCFHQKHSFVFSFLIQTPSSHNSGNLLFTYHHKDYERSNGKVYLLFSESHYSLNDFYLTKITKPFYKFTRDKMVTRSTSKKGQSAPSSPTKKPAATKKTTAP